MLCGLYRGSVLFEFVSEFCNDFLLNFYYVRFRGRDRAGEEGGRGGASVPIKCVKIIKNGRERNREKVTKTEKKSVNFDGNKQRLRTGTESTNRVKGEEKPDMLSILDVNCHWLRN